MVRYVPNTLEKDPFNDRHRSPLLPLLFALK